MPNRPTETWLASVAAPDSSAQSGSNAVRALLEALGDGLWDWNLLTGEIIFSPAYQGLLGYRNGEFGHHLDEWIKRVHPDDAKHAMQVTRACLDTTTATYEDEHRLLCRDGNWKWVRARGAIVERSADGRPTRLLGTISDISERKRIEQQLGAADQQMQLIMKASHQGLYDFNIQTGEGHFSAEYARMLGLAEEDFKDAKKFWNFFWNESIHPDDVAGLKHAYQAHFSSSGKVEFSAEFRQRARSGEWRWIMSLGRVIEWDKQGRALRMVGTHSDISERKNAEQAARHHEELLSASKDRYKQLANELDILVSNAPVGIMFVSDGRIVRANKTLAELCGFPDAKVMIGIASTFLYQDEADYRAFGALAIPKLIADEPVELEWLVRRIDGSSFLARVAGRALPSEQYVRGAVWMIEDITAQRRTHDALKQSEQRLQRLMNSNLVGIAQGMEEARLIDVNKMFVQLSGYPRAALLGNENIWDLLLSAQDLETFKLAYAELLATGCSAAFEIMLRQHDGHTVPVLVGLSYLENSHSEWVMFMMDISERHRINQLKSEFISVVSHELRTPLTSIRGSLGLLEAGIGGELPFKAQHLIKIAHKNSRRLVGLVNDILDLEKLASGKMSFKSERIDLVYLLEQAIEANLAYALALNVRLELRAHPGAAWVNADPDRLMQVLANLLSNAAKFSPKGETVRLQIVPYLARGKPHYRVEVSDLGPGIPASFQTRIFEPFTQADGTDTRQQGGTGLGLSISKTLVEKMHGQLGFITAEGQGSTFWFKLEAAE